MVAAATVAISASGKPTLTLRSVHSPSQNANVVATPGGRTLYHRTRETTHHFLCTGSCTQVWPPLTVASRSTRLVDGPGVHGRLGIVRRPDGRLQVTLNGQPLYRFAQDHRRGDANGEGVLGERPGGGTWHAERAASRKAPPAATSPGYYTPAATSSPGSTPTTTSPGYTPPPTTTTSTGYTPPPTTTTSPPCTTYYCY
jgi:predicted lipoprotein with Yx(FWY)xxD motif